MPTHRIELQFTGYKAVVLPLNYVGIINTESETRTRTRKPQSGLNRQRLPFRHPGIIVKRMTGIEPALLGWKPKVLPLYDIRMEAT